MRTIPGKVTTINMETGEQIESESKATLMPAPPGTCPDCACKHDSRLPHNKDSLFYQMAFQADNGRWPTWADAMAHCTDDVKIQLVAFLDEKGINANG